MKYANQYISHTHTHILTRTHGLIYHFYEDEWGPVYSRFVLVMDRIATPCRITCTSRTHFNDVCDSQAPPSDISTHRCDICIFIRYTMQTYLYIDGLLQERRNSSALAMKLRLSCTNPSIYYMNVNDVWISLIQSALWYDMIQISRKLPLM